MNAAIAFLAVALLTVHSDALTLSPFNNVTSGVLDAWNQSNPENVRGGRFGIRYGGGKLWLVSQRLHRRGFSDPWDSAARGGIVSTLSLSNKAWTHKSYDRLDEDKRGDKLFSLNGYLFMLTYSTSQKIAFHKLFFWDDNAGKWSEVPFEIDPNASTTSTNTIQGLSVNVPKQDGKTAYLVASAHGQARGGGELAFSKLEVEISTKPVKAKLKLLARQQTQQPSAAFFTAAKNDKLYALVQHFYSEGYVSEYEFAYTLDLKTNRTGNVSLTGQAPGVSFSNEHMHQTENEVLIVGGTQTYGLGQLRTVKDIFVLNLNTFQWQTTPYKIPEDAGSRSAIDQEAKKLYLVGLKEGVREARITNN